MLSSVPKYFGLSDANSVCFTAASHLNIRKNGAIPDDSVAFVQHCIQSTVTHLTHVEGVEDVKFYVLCIQWPLDPARREGYLL